MCDNSFVGQEWFLTDTSHITHDKGIIMATIETSVFDTLITITFRNTAINEIGTTVCVNREVMAATLARIESSDHLKLICVTDAVVAR